MPTQRRSASSPRGTSRTTEEEAPSGTRAAKKAATPRKATAKKSTTKSATKKTAAKKTAARSTPAEGRTASPARARSDEAPSREPDQEREESRTQERDESRTREHEPERRSSRPSGREVATMLADELEFLTGKEPESIVRLGRDDDGWVVGIEVVESRRIPDSTDILAVYEVHADDDGSLRSYERTRRYTRGRTVDE